MKKKIAIMIGAGVFAIALGLGIYKSDASQSEPKLNYDEVTNLITDQYPGKITEIELEKEYNRAVYEIEIVNQGMEYELKVDGNSGEILKLKEKKIAKNEKDDTELIEKEKKEKTTQDTKVEKKESTSNEKKNTVLDAKEAIAIAQKEFQGTVTDVELDEDDGRLIYEIELKGNGEEAEFEIDAMTGEIIVIEIDED